METLIVYPQTEAKAKAIKAILKVLDISFEKSKYNQEFVKKIKQGEDDFKKGNFTKISLDDLWK